MKTCLNCQKLFKPLIQSKGMYCSRSCADKHKIPWNKGKKIDMKLYPHYGITGRKHTQETKEKIRKIKLNDPLIRGENWYKWKGDAVGYRALHEWVEEQLGKPDTCEFCNKSGLSGKQIHWANRSGLYLRDITDWIRLCVKCHRQYDRNLRIALGRKTIYKSEGRVIQ